MKVIVMRQRKSRLWISLDPTVLRPLEELVEDERNRAFYTAGYRPRTISKVIEEILADRLENGPRLVPHA